MTTLRFLLVASLLAGCAANPLSRVELMGGYPKAIDKAEWARTKYGVYIKRGVDFDETPHIRYSVLYDNTGYKQDLAKRYETDENFKKYVASFIIHEGKVNCARRENASVVTQYDENMKTLRSEQGVVYSEASNFICMILKEKDR